MSPSVGTAQPSPWTPRRDPPPLVSDVASPVVGALAHASEAEIEAARRHRDHLVHAAVAVIAACGHAPGAARCDGTGCDLAQLVDGVAICQLAHDLARLPDAPPVGAPPAMAAAVAQFRARLVGAADAVRHCRRSQHGSGQCWFTATPAADGCRDVLRLLHRVC